MKRHSNHAKYVPCPNNCGHLKHPDGKECRWCSAKKKSRMAKAAAAKAKGVDAQAATCNRFSPDGTNARLDAVASNGCKATVESFTR